MRVLSLFSGIGSYETALKRLGIDFTLNGYAEIDEYPSKGYSLVYGEDESKNLGNVAQINEQLLEDFDLLVYSPPCQPFSRAGKEQGVNDERGVLFFDALRIIKHKKPKYAIMENVRALTQPKFKNEYKAMMEGLEKAGYRNYVANLNAKEYGLPQNRDRVFVVSIREDANQSFDFNLIPKRKGNLRDHLDADVESIIVHNLYGRYKEKSVRIYSDFCPAITANQGGGHIPSVILKNSREIIESGDYLQKQYKLIVKRHDQKYYHVKDKKITQDIGDYLVLRWMNARECFSVQGFKDEEVYDRLQDSFSSLRLTRMAGNAVPVTILVEIFKQLLEGELK